MPFMSNIPPRNFTEQFQNLQNAFESTEPKNLYEVIIKYNGNVSKIAEELDINIEILSKNYSVTIFHAAKKLVRLIFASQKSGQPYLATA